MEQKHITGKMIKGETLREIMVRNIHVPEYIYIYATDLWRVKPLQFLFIFGGILFLVRVKMIISVSGVVGNNN